MTSEPAWIFVFRQKVEVVVTSPLPERCMVKEVSMARQIVSEGSRQLLLAVIIAAPPSVNVVMPSIR